MQPFAALNAAPHRDGAGRALSAELRVPDDTPDKAVVRRGNAVMVIKVKLRQGRKVYFVFVLFGYKRREFVVE